MCWPPTTGLLVHGKWRIRPFKLCVCLLLQLLWWLAWHRPSEVVAAAAPQKSVVYVDPVSRHLLALAQRVAQANVTALIEGPTGAGKEILARVLHESSKRARGPFRGFELRSLARATH
jgi:transcriptional regulator of acetoin/glycerol metabolism